MDVAWGSTFDLIGDNLISNGLILTLTELFNDLVAICNVRSLGDGECSCGSQGLASCSTLSANDAAESNSS